MVKIINNFFNLIKDSVIDTKIAIQDQDKSHPIYEALDTIKNVGPALSIGAVGGAIASARIAALNVGSLISKMRTWLDFSDKTQNFYFPSDDEIFN